MNYTMKFIFIIISTSSHWSLNVIDNYLKGVSKIMANQNVCLINLISV